jgi:hypothetical protein
MLLKRMRKKEKRIKHDDSLKTKNKTISAIIISIYSSSIFFFFLQRSYLLGNI